MQKNQKITARINVELARVEERLNIMQELTEDDPNPDTIQTIMKAIEESREATRSIMQELVKLLSMSARI